MDKTGSQIRGSYWSLCGLGGNNMGHLQLLNIPVGKTGPWMRGSCGPDGNSIPIHSYLIFQWVRLVHG